MFAMNLDTLIAGVCDLTFGRGFRPDYHMDKREWHGRGLLFRFDVQLAYYGGGSEQRSERREVFFAICGHHVFFAHRGFASRKPISELTWENTSNHDSCWRSDGLGRPLNELYFEMSRQVNSKRKKDVAPRDMSEHVFTPLSRPLFERVNMSWHRDPTDERNYKRELFYVGKDPVEMSDAELSS